MKVLYITGRHPWPPNKGDQLISYNQIKRLAGKHEIHLVTRPSHDHENALEFENLCRSVTHINISRPSMVINAMKTLLNKKPLQVNMFSHRRELERVEEAIDRIRPDIVHVQTIRMADYGILKGNNTLTGGEKPRLIMDMIDLLSLNMRRRAAREKGIISMIMNYEGRLVEEYEKELANHYDRMVFVSRHDASMSGLDNTRVNPNGTHVTSDRLEAYDIGRKKQILFHGNMNYFPNAEAALYFAERIWPEIHRRHPDYSFVIAGRNPVRRIRNLSGKAGIVLRENVDDMVELLLESEIGVYILRSGTGLQNKILEALGSGLPVVASSVALGGIGRIDENTVISVDGDKEVIEALDRLIQDGDLRERMSIKGKAFMRDRFTWEQNVSRLEKIWMGKD